MEKGLHWAMEESLKWIILKHKKIIKYRDQICSAKSLEDLAYLLEVDSLQLLNLSSNPHYNVYHYPKSDGSMRLIEDPIDPLKKVLRVLQKYLQSVYFFERTDAAYGFLISSHREDNPRNIFSNAQQHIGCKSMYKTDLEDFFHQIKSKDVLRIFTKGPFRFKPKVKKVLTNLVCFKGRLPMGSPSSPILSNYRTINMDKDLTNYCQKKQITYTRFADDLSFSSPMDNIRKSVRAIDSIIYSHGFTINHEKSKVINQDEEKEVTGLIAGRDDIHLSHHFLESLKQESIRYLKAKEAAYIYGDTNMKWLKRYKEKLDGMFVFAENVDDSKTAIWKKYQKKIDYHKETHSKIMSWRDFPYI